MTKSVKLSNLMAIMIVAIMLFAGCGGSSSLDKSIGQVEKALERIEKNKGNMTEADWQILEKEMEEPLKVIADALENNKVSMMERVKLMTVVGKWSVVIMEAGFSEIEKQTGIDRENWGNELEKASEELQKAAEELQKALEGSATNN